MGSSTRRHSLQKNLQRGQRTAATPAARAVAARAPATQQAQPRIREDLFDGGNAVALAVALAVLTRSRASPASSRVSAGRNTRRARLDRRARRRQQEPRRARPEHALALGGAPQRLRDGTTQTLAAGRSGRGHGRGGRWQGSLGGIGSWQLLGCARRWLWRRRRRRR